MRCKHGCMMQLHVLIMMHPTWVYCWLHDKKDTCFRHPL